MSCSFVGDSCSSQKGKGSQGCGQHSSGPATSAAPSVPRLSAGARAGSPRLASLLSLQRCGVFAGAAALPWAGVCTQASSPTSCLQRGRDRLPGGFIKYRGDHGIHRSLRETQADWGWGDWGWGGALPSPSSAGAVYESTQRSEARGIRILFG